MVKCGYQLRQAVSDLATAKLLSGCLLAAEGRWFRYDLSRDGAVPEDLAAAGSESLAGVLGGSFHGAKLDSRQVVPGCLFVALQGEHTDGRLFVTAALEAGASVLTRAWSPPAEDPLLAGTTIARGLVLLTADPRAGLVLLARRWREHQPAQVTAITGSNGKTTTKDLLAACLRSASPTCATAGNLNNELGVPLTLLDLRPDHCFAVVEMGASAAGEIARLTALAGPTVGVITNAAEAHLAEFGSLEGVIRGKGELVEALPAAGIAVLNADSPGFAYWRERAACQVVSFGRDAGEHRWAWRPDRLPGRGVVTLGGQDWQVPLPGRHNGANLVAAVLAARANGLADDQIRQGLLSFTASPHRSTLVEVAGRWLLDDSYNANPTSMASAAEALVALPATGRRIAVLGFMAELGPDSDDIHLRTGQRLAYAGIDLLVTVGPQARRLAEGFASAGGKVRSLPNQTEAAAWLGEQTNPGDAVLVKGSRAAGMEVVVTELKKRWLAVGTTD